MFLWSDIYVHINHLVVPYSCCTFVRIIYDKIDKDQNGEISNKELTSWIQHVQMRYIVSDTERQWHDHIPEDDDNKLLTWDLYLEKTYGHVEGIIAHS